jgi:hypothetical protein
LESVLHDDGVFQAPFGAQFLADDLLQQSDVMLFQPFVEELRRMVTWIGQDVVRQLQIFAFILVLR